MDRLILSEIVGLFIGGVLLFTGLFFAAGELVRLADFLQRGEGWLLVGQLWLYTLPNVLAFTFPMAMLLATLLGFGRLSGDSEIIALTAAGVRFERIMVPVAVFGLLASLVGYGLNNYIAPAASAQRNVIIDRVMKGAAGNGLLSADIFPLKRTTGDNEFIIVNAEGISNLGRGELTQVSVERWKNGKPQVYIFAPRATWDIGTPNWTFFDCQVTAPPDLKADQSGLDLSAEGGTTREIKQAIDTPERLAYLKARPEDTATPDLLQRARFYRDSGNQSDARATDVEIARRQNLPWATLAFALIGAPLGVSPARAPKGVGFGISVIVTFAYYIGLQVMITLGKSGAIPAPLALAVPNLACLAVGIFLIRRVLR